MTNYVIDAYVWIEYLKGSEKGEEASKIIDNNTNEIFTSSTTIAEIVSKYLREKGDVETALHAINSISKPIDVNREIGMIAGKIHFEAKKKNKYFGMLDAFVVATARKFKAKILTGDSDFKPFKETEFI